MDLYVGCEALRRQVVPRLIIVVPHRVVLVGYVTAEVRVRSTLYSVPRSRVRSRSERRRSTESARYVSSATAVNTEPTGRAADRSFHSDRRVRVGSE